MKSRWYANKFGLLNFWYYDEEEFQLSKGRILLRGSNGSGKSVTMQSFIPFLLDGNKSPERLDPFGTRARKMENYLLDDKNDERTAYLYIEFKKNDSETYLTIGTGMKAVKNKAMQSWYFIILDGRRINRDFYLYENVGEKIPLTKRQFKNRLGDGGLYIESQKEFMAKVNEYLFGFDDVENYEELINLLIQLRSPKLSKDFKPTEIYKILSSSLNTLSDEDLRPMSESMENMDSLKNRYEDLERCMKAAKAIKIKYDNLNKFYLKDKSLDLLECYKKSQKIENEIKEMKKTYKSSEEEVVKLEEEINIYEDELKKWEIKYDELSKSEIMEFKKKLLELEEIISNLKEEIKNTREKIKIKEKVSIEKLNSRKESKDRIEIEEIKLVKELDEMDEIRQEFSFDEGGFLKEELLKDMESYNFNHVNNTLDKYLKKLKEASKVLGQYKVSKEKVLQEQQKVDIKTIAKEKYEKELQEANSLFSDTKDDLVSNVNRWNEKNKEFIIPLEVLQSTFKEIANFQNAIYVNKINENIHKYYFNCRNDNKLIKSKIINDNEEVLKEKSLLKEIIEELKKKKEVEPERSIATINNRKRLDSLGIAYIPLYKAVEFQKDIDQKQMKIIENALLQMGLLDALIINKEDIEKAKKILEDDEDRYLVANPNIMSFTLSNYLKVDERELAGVKTVEVLDVLQSILVDKNNDIYIDEKGNYKISLLMGKASFNYKERFIGATARKAHREAMIKEKENEILELEEKINKNKEEIRFIEKKNEVLEAEFKKMPEIDDLQKALEIREEKIQQLKINEKELRELEERLFKLQEELGEIKSKVFHITEKINIEKNREAFDEAIEAGEEYKNHLSETRIKVNSIVKEKQYLYEIEDSLSNIDADLDDLHYRENIKEIELKKRENEVLAFEDMLNKNSIDEIEKEIEICLKKKKELPQKIKEFTAAHASLKEKIKTLIEYVESKKKDLVLENRKLELYKLVFEKEYSLQYVVAKKDEDVIKIVKEILTNIDIDKNKFKEDYISELYKIFNIYNGDLRDYSVKIVEILQIEDEEAENPILAKSRRQDIYCRIEGKEVKFNSLIEKIQENIGYTKSLIDEKEREIFEEILINTISNKIKSKIKLAQIWVAKMNDLFVSMDTSSGLTFDLKWKAKKAESEEEMDISMLAEILGRGNLSSEEEIKRISTHFGHKLKEEIRMLEDTGEERNYQTIIKNLLDYRNWFEFKLSFQKTGENKKELTNNEFYRFSGGEKAMSMYMPLFAAVYARYESASNDCPRLIALDEAFAGVDENNIRDMFKKLQDLDLDYAINSQVLWGDYDTVDDLAISEIVRDGNDDVITIIKYHWNGVERELSL